MDTINPRWLWVIVFAVGSIATIGFMILYKLTKQRFAEYQRQLEQHRTPPVEPEIVDKIIAETTAEIKSTSEELPEAEIKS